MTSPRPTATPTPPPDPKAFYVVSECCLACGIPEAIAPELFEWQGRACRVKRQPGTLTELDQMIEAIACSEVDCIRYGGSDPEILGRLGEAGFADQADDPAAADHPLKLRSRVTFRMTGEDGQLTPKLIARLFANDQRALGRLARRGFLAPATVRVAWYERRFHSVRFTAMPTPGRWLATLESSVMPGLSRLVYDWLRARDASDIRWFASGEDLDGKGQLTPL